MQTIEYLKKKIKEEGDRLNLVTSLPETVREYVSHVFFWKDTTSLTFEVKDLATLRHIARTFAPVLAVYCDNEVTTEERAKKKHTSTLKKTNGEVVPILEWYKEKGKYFELLSPFWIDTQKVGKYVGEHVEINWISEEYEICVKVLHQCYPFLRFETQTDTFQDEEYTKLTGMRRTPPITCNIPVFPLGQKINFYGNRIKTVCRYNPRAYEAMILDGELSD